MKLAEVLKYLVVLALAKFADEVEELLENDDD